MRLKQIRLVRFVMAVFVTLSFAFLPMISQQAMAGHHVNDGINLAAAASGHKHESGSCEKKSETQSTDKQMNCCDTNCSTFAAFEATEVPIVQLKVADHFEINAEQLTSRITFGLMRPPRA
jgi:hypothetical protein